MVTRGIRIAPCRKSYYASLHDYLLAEAARRHARRADWARTQFEALRAPLLTCEAVLSEASFLLRRAGADPGLPARLVRRGVLEVAGLLNSDADADALARLMRRYADVPMSFADACLVRLVERTPHGSVLTLDSGFRAYRQARRRTIPLLIP